MVPRAGWLKTGLKMLGVGVLLGWASVYALPALVRWGVPERAANRLPFLAFFAGAAWGLASASSRAARGLLSFALLVPVTGGVFWFFGLLLGGVLAAAGLSPVVADYVPVVAFFFGASLAFLPGVVVGSEALSTFFSRAKRRAERRNKRAR